MSILNFTNSSTHHCELFIVFSCLSLTNIFATSNFSSPSFSDLNFFTDTWFFHYKHSIKKITIYNFSHCLFNFVLIISTEANFPRSVLCSFLYNYHYVVLSSGFCYVIVMFCLHRLHIPVILWIGLKKNSFYWFLSFSVQAPIIKCHRLGGS